jgi:hypothetical protein
MRQELDGLHIDIGILFPDHLLKIPVITQNEYAAAIARAYNAWLLGQSGAAGAGPSWLHPRLPHDPEDAAREIRKYAKEPGMVGVFLPCAGWSGSGATAVRPDLRGRRGGRPAGPLHSVTVVHPVFPFNTHRFETEFGRHICSHTFSMMANLVT